MSGMMGNVAGAFRDAFNRSPTNTGGGSRYNHNPYNLANNARTQSLSRYGNRSAQPGWARGSASWGQGGYGGISPGRMALLRSMMSRSRGPQLSQTTAGPGFFGQPYRQPANTSVYQPMGISKQNEINAAMPQTRINPYSPSAIDPATGPTPSQQAAQREVYQQDFINKYGFPLYKPGSLTY